MSDKSEIMLIVFRETGVGGKELDSCVDAISKYILEKIKSKDQQIKDLESLLEHASIVIDLKTDNTTFEKLRSEYQQKYPKQ